VVSSTVMLTEDQAFWFTIGLFALIGIITLARQGWWGLLQITVFCGVMGSNIQWHWTPNNYLAGLLATLAAYLVTIALTKLLSLVTRQERLPYSHQRLKPHVSGRIEPTR